MQKDEMLKLMDILELTGLSSDQINKSIRYIEGDNISKDEMRQYIQGENSREN